MKRKTLVTLTVEPWPAEEPAEANGTFDTEGNTAAIDICTAIDREDVKTAALEIIKPYVNKSINNVVTDPGIAENEQIRAIIETHLFTEYDNDPAQYEAARADVLEDITPPILQFEVVGTAKNNVDFINDITYDILEYFAE